MNAEIITFCNRLLGALCTGVYQGVLLTVVIWLGLRLARRTNAATRHAVWMATLMAVALLPAIHLFVPVSTAPILIPITTAPAALEERVNLGGEERDIEAADEGLNLVQTEEAAESAASLESRAPAEEPVQVVSDTWSETTSAREMLSPGVSLLEGSDVAKASPRPKTAFGSSLSIPAWTAALLISVLVLVVFVRLAGLAWQCIQLQLLKRRGAPAPEALTCAFRSISLEMGILRKPRLMTSARIGSPMLAGFAHPAVLLPAHLLEDNRKTGLEGILRHELAHVRRGDDWANLIQQVIRAIFFFHPAVLWLSRRLTIEREIACDDHVLAAMRAPRQYALLLTEFAGRMNIRDWAAAPAAWSNKSQLKERISMILDAKRNASTRPGRWSVGILTAAAASLAVCGLLAAPRIALAEESVDVLPEVAITAEVEPVIEAVASVNVQIEPIEVQVEPVVIASADYHPAPPGLPDHPGHPSAPRAKPQPHPQPAAKPAPRAGYPAPAVAPHPPYGLPAPPAAQIAALPPQHPGPMMLSAQPARGGGDSVERRVERLERLVESLIAQEKGPKEGPGHPKDRQFNFKGPDWPKDKQLKFELGLEEKELARMHAQIARDAERMKADSARMAREVERSVREAHRFGSLEQKKRTKEGLKNHRQMLESQRKALEKQIEELEKQLEHLDDQEEREQEEREEREQEEQETKEEQEQQKEQERQKQREQQRQEEQGKEKPRR